MNKLPIQVPGNLRGAGGSSKRIHVLLLEGSEEYQCDSPLAGIWYSAVNQSAKLIAAKGELPCYSTTLLITQLSRKCMPCSTAQGAVFPFFPP